MKALVVCASKYGSTMQIGRWIAERLSYDAITSRVSKPEEAGSLDDYELIFIGSGIYNHNFLPSFIRFIDENRDVLKTKKIVLFGVAMKTEAVFHKGMIHGGIEHIKPYVEKLDRSVIHADMLHGEMVPHKMDEKDIEGLKRFYKMLNLSEEEILIRMSPRTLMDKKEVWEFTEAAIKKLNSNAEVGDAGSRQGG